MKITQKQRHAGYFEGILQLRNPKNSSFVDVHDFVVAYVEKSDKVDIAKQKKVKNGIDLYLSSKRVAKKIGEELQKRFGGELSWSEQLFSRDRQTSKDIFRLNVLFRLSDFNVGDIIEVDNQFLKIKSIRKGKVVGTNLATHKIESRPSKHAVVAATKADFETVVVSKHKPHLEVLHPDTYESVAVCNPQETRRGKVKVVELDEKLWLV